MCSTTAAYKTWAFQSMKEENKAEDSLYFHIMSAVLDGNVFQMCCMNVHTGLFTQVLKEHQ